MQKHGEVIWKKHTLTLWSIKLTNVIWLVGRPIPTHGGGCYLKLNCQGKRNFNLKQLKQKFNGLRVTYREFSDLLKHTGFGWDAETNTVIA